MADNAAPPVMSNIVRLRLLSLAPDANTAAQWIAARAGADVATVSGFLQGDVAVTLEQADLLLRAAGGASLVEELWRRFTGRAGEQDDG